MHIQTEAVPARMSGNNNNMLIRSASMNRFKCWPANRITIDWMTMDMVY